MSKIEAPKRIRAEDYDKDDRALISRLSPSVNDFQESVYQLLNGKIDFDNLAQKIVDVDVQIDGTGLLVNRPQIKSGLIKKVIGIQCITAINLINPAIYPNNQPFISFTINSDIITILNVSGLQNNSKYTLRLQLIT